MSVNGISNVGANAYEALTTTQTENKPVEEVKDNTSEKGENGVVYEPSKDSVNVPVKKYVQNTELVNKMKADAEEHSKQLRNIVEKMMTKQSQTSGIANGDMWKFLASGKFEVDEATKLQAQQDIAEDGYWGVKQTSERMVNFGKALVGGDPARAGEMRDAFIKGYEAATKAWGGALPSIAKETYDASMKLFDEWENEGKKNDESVEEAPETEGSKE